MSWSDTKNKLLKAAKIIKQNKILDATVEAALSQIPVVGPFASKYWSIIEGDNATKAEIVSKFLEMAAQQEEHFKELTAILEQQGEILLENKTSLESIHEILLARFKTIEEKFDSLEDKVDLILQHLGVKTVSEAFATSISKEDDRLKAENLIGEVEEVIDKAGKHANAETSCKLGISYLALNQFEKAQKYFRAAIEVNPKLSQAYVGLAGTYQLQANEMISRENYGLAEEALGKAEDYIKAAWLNDAGDINVDAQLGYIQKDLAMRYTRTGQNNKGQMYLQKAETIFKRVLEVDQSNASAYNGIGNIYYLRGDYDSAIKYSLRAVELQPKYLFAYYDLLISHYQKARDPSLKKDDYRRVLQGILAATQSIMGLHGTDAGSLPPSALDSVTKIVQWAAQEAERTQQ